MGAGRKFVRNLSFVSFLRCSIAPFLRRVRSGAQEALEEYFKRIGGRPQLKPKGQKKRKNQSISGSGQGRGKGKKFKQDGDEDAASEDNVVRATRWEPPKGSWEDEVISVDTVEEQPNHATGQKERYALINWKNGKRTSHPLKVVNQKCPQRVSLDTSRITGLD